MATSQFRQFLRDATTPDPDTDSPLGAEALYGLYMSWCPLHRLTPRTDASFRAGMRRCRVSLRGSRRRMKGRAAAGHQLASYPYAG